MRSIALIATIPILCLCGTAGATNYPPCPASGNTCTSAGSGPATWTPASLACGDVAQCNSNAVNGDIIALPPGSITYSTAPLAITKNIRITAANGINTVYLTNQVPSSNNDGAIEYTSAASDPYCSTNIFELDHINIISGVNSSSNDAGNVKASGGCGQLKIHDNIFTAGSGFSEYFVVVEWGAGVIYNNTFNQTGSGGSNGAVILKAANWVPSGGSGSYGFGDGSFIEAPHYINEGNASPDLRLRFLYVEGNTYVSNQSTFYSGNNAGGRIIHRFNTITNGNLSGHGFDSDSGGRGRAMRETFAYNNVLKDTLGSGICWLFRGGTGFGYGNLIIGWGTSCIKSQTYRNVNVWGTNNDLGLSVASGDGLCLTATTSFSVCDNGTWCYGDSSRCNGIGSGNCTSYTAQCPDGTGCGNTGGGSSNAAVAIGSDCPTYNGTVYKCQNYSGARYMCNSRTSGNGCCNPSGLCSDGITPCNNLGGACTNGNPYSATGPNTCTATAYPANNCGPDTGCNGGASQCIGPVDNTAGNGQGWPCRDGTGMGMDATSGCDSYTVSGNLTGAGCPQNVEPLYTWNNSGTNGTFTTAESAGVSQAVQNTDYFVDNLGGNNSAATNSTGAIYWGANSAKGTCTYGSAPYAYFTTDTRSLYRCNPDSTWGDGAGNSTPYYTELACPNPLTGLTGSCNNSMAGVGGYPSGSPGVSSTGQVTGNMSR